MAKSPENKKEISRLNRLAAPLGLLGLAIVSLSAYSEKQKDAIKERDGGCQFPGEHQCSDNLVIHQIVPPKYAKKFGINPDFAENGLTICDNALKIIWPDAQVPPEKIPAAMKTRAIKLNQRLPYWNTVFDRSMGALAVRNTQNAEAKGWEFPVKKTRKKKS